MEVFVFFFFQAEDSIRDLVRSRGLGDVYKRQVLGDREIEQDAGALAVFGNEKQTEFDRVGGRADMGRLAVDADDHVALFQARALGHLGLALVALIGGVILTKFTGSFGNLTLPMNISALFIGAMSSNWMLKNVKLPGESTIEAPLMVSMIGMTIATLLMIWWIQGDAVRRCSSRGALTRHESLNCSAAMVMLPLLHHAFSRRVSQ